MVAGRLGYSGAAVADRDLHHVAVEPGAHHQLAEIAAVFDDIGNCVRRIHQQVEDHLIDLAEIARYPRQLTELRAQIRDVLVFVVRDDEGAANGLIQVGQRHLCLIRMRKFLHRPHDRGDPAEALDGALEGLRGIAQDVIEVGGLLGVLGELQCRGHIPRGFRRVLEIAVGANDRGDIRHGRAHELHVVRDELDRRVDLVSDSRRQPADGLELLRRRELAAETPQFGHVEHQSAQNLRARHLLAGSRPAHFGAAAVAL